MGRGYIDRVTYVSIVKQGLVALPRPFHVLLHITVWQEVGSFLQRVHHFLVGRNLLLKILNNSTKQIM